MKLRYLAVAFVCAIPSTVMANTITVTPTPIVTGVGPYLWTYAVTLEGNSQVNPGDFFTIFDFAGLVAGSQSPVLGWTASSSNTGVCPAQAPFPVLCSLADDSLVPNLTWTRTGAAIVNVGGSSPLGNFSAQSIYNLRRNDFFVSQDQDNDTGTPQEAAGGNTNVPTAVPEPTSLVLLGSGLLALARKLRK